MGLGDQISQNLIENKSYENIDFLRTAQFATVGFFIVVSSKINLLVFINLLLIFHKYFLKELQLILHAYSLQQLGGFYIKKIIKLFQIQGPATGTWYKILDRYFGSKGTLTVFKKVTCDQLLFTPPFLLCLLSVIGTIQKGTSNLKNVLLKLEDEYMDILSNNYKVISTDHSDYCTYLQNFNFSSFDLLFLVMANGTIDKFLFCSTSISSFNCSNSCNFMEYIHIIQDQ